MKILVLHSELGVLRGGGENFTRNLFTAVAERGHHVTAAFVADATGRYPLPLPGCFEAIPLRGWWSRKLGQGTMSALGRRVPLLRRHRAAWDRVQEAICWRTIRWHSRRFQRRIEQEFAGRWHEYDLVYVHGNAALAASVSRRRPAMVRLTGPVAAGLVPVLRAVQVVCANGDAFARVRPLLGDHVVELPIGLDDRRFCPGPSSVRSALGWTEQHCVIGYVGRLTHLKGIDLLAEAFRDLSEVAPEMRLLIIGSGEEESNVRSVLSRALADRQAHIQPDVNHDNLAEWYRAMDVLVMPSRYENFSNAVLEAMATGTPFLGSDIGGNRMLAETGAGWLFPAGSASALVQALSSIVADRAEIGYRGANGAAYVRGRFSWSATAERLETIIASRLSVST